MVTQTQVKQILQERTDDDLVRDVAKALWDDTGLRWEAPAALHIAAREGIVTLRGYAVSRAHRGRAIEAARHVPGVRDVRDELSCRRPPLCQATGLSCG